MKGPPKLLAAWLTRKGTKNSENQDRAFIDRQLGLFIIADGLGGYKGGALASSIAVNTISRVISSRIEHIPSIAALEHLLYKSLVDTNRAIRTLSQSRRSIENMATTVVVAIIWEQIVLVANVGDTRAYVMRAGDLYPISQDHSAAAELVSARLLNPNESREHPFRNIVTRTLGSAQTVQPYFSQSPVTNVDMLLLCTDGLWSVLPDALIQRELQRNGTVFQRCSRLVNLAVKHGSTDDITCAVVETSGPLRQITCHKSNCRYSS